MSDIERNTMTDEKLEAAGIEIPADETDESFFAWLDGMIKEVMGDDPDASE